MSEITEFTNKFKVIKMRQQIFSTEELNSLRDIMDQQLEITESFMEASVANSEFIELFKQTQDYFKFKHIVEMIKNLDFNFTYDDYKTMLIPLDYFYEMLQDTEEDVELLYNVAAMQAKAKVYMELYPEESENQ